MPRTVTYSYPDRIHVSQGGVELFSYSMPERFYGFWTRPDIQRTRRVLTGGWRPPTSYYSRKIVSAGPSGTWRDGKSSGGPWMYTGNLRGAIPDAQNLRYPPEYSSGLKSRAIIDALTKLKSQNVNLAQALAERNQTAGLVASNLTKIAKCALAVKRGDFLSALREVGLHRTRRGYRIRRPQTEKEFAKRWLELQYGWKPLLSDIYGALKDLGESEKGTPLFVTVRGTASEQWQEIRSPVDNVGFLPCTITATKQRGCKVVLTYTPLTSMLRTVSSVGLTNPMMLAWELLPWSFVVDWALPIGDILNIADATAGWNFLGGTITERSTINTVYGNGESPDRLSRFDGYGFYKAVFMDREAIFTSPLPTAVPLKNPFSAPHVMNALALLRTAFSGWR